MNHDRLGSVTHDDGDAAPSTIGRMLATYRPLVVAMASKHGGEDREDAIIEGVRGLLDALTRFDASSGDRFGAHAAYWVRRRILERARLDLVPC
jgi:RNA polymerase sigma factor (sigma-70 family)